MKIFVGNLSAEITQDELLQLFQETGNVKSAKIILDKDTGLSRGFGFVEMQNKREGQAAIANLNGAELKGASLKVSKARGRVDNQGGRIIFKGNKYGNYSRLKK